MNQSPRVSVIVIFLNEERFLAETIESVRAQTWQDWELVLVDDGSTEGSTSIAKSYAATEPGRIRYLHHPDHVNRGMSSSRNVGLQAARGDLIAFVDGDDVWLPRKLQEQVERLDGEARAGLLYGRTLIWHSWSPDSEAADFYYPLGVTPNRLYHPPRLFNVLMRNHAQTPTTCNALIRRTLIDRVGGFEDSFRGMFEDQVFFAKALLDSPAYVDGRTWAMYRQHPDSRSRRSSGTLAEQQRRVEFLSWLRQHVRERGAPASARLAMARATLDSRVRLLRRKLAMAGRSMP